MFGNLSFARMVGGLVCICLGAGPYIQQPSLEKRLKTLEDRVLALELKLEPPTARSWTRQQIKKLFRTISDLQRGAASPAALYRNYKYNVPERLLYAQRDLEQACDLAMRAERRLVAHEAQMAAAMAGRAMDIFNRIAKRLGAETFDSSK